jgi:hypothetical protein
MYTSLEGRLRWAGLCDRFKTPQEVRDHHLTWPRKNPPNMNLRMVHVDNPWQREWRLLDRAVCRQDFLEAARRMTWAMSWEKAVARELKKN